MKKRFGKLKGLTALALGGMLALTACSGGDAGGDTPDDGGYQVGYLMYDLGLDPYMNAFQVALEEAAAESNVELTVGDGQNDVSVMNGIMDQYIVSQMDAIIIAPPDPESLVSSSLKAKDAGIPVFSAIFTASEEAELVSHIAPDDEEQGRIQAQIVADALDGEGKVALQTGELGTAIEIERTRGFKEVLEEYPDIELVEEQPNDWQSDVSLALTQNWLSKYGEGEIDAIVAQGPDLVGGAEWALSQGRDDVLFIGLDYSNDIRNAIISGSVFATVNGDPAAAAQETIKAIIAHLNGEEVSDRIIVDAPVIDASNAEETPAAF